MLEKGTGLSHSISTTRSDAAQHKSVRDTTAAAYQHMKLIYAVSFSTIHGFILQVMLLRAEFMYGEASEVLVAEHTILGEGRSEEVRQGRRPRRHKKINQIVEGTEGHTGQNSPRSSVVKCGAGKGERWTRTWLWWM